jgi:type IV pilus assembly protein PilY1
MSWFISRALHPGLVAAVLLLLLAMASTGSRAAVTDISAEPVLTRSTASAKPNLMFILDDSGSMDWSFMPDEMGDANRSPRDGTYGYWSPQCNGLAFNPSGDYPPPVRADGTSYPNMSFTAARTDGYLDGSSTVNLTDAFYFRYTGTEPALSWKFNASGVVDTTTTFYRECLSNYNALPGASKFTQVALKNTTPEERQKHANWYSYYSRRFLLMRTAVGKAVQALDAGYRLGFSRINDASITDGANFRDVKPFDATQKTNFYSSLYGAAPGGGTPLRGALSKVGRYFAKKLPGQTYDPVEHSCQRNYAILSTDGYWNSGGFPGVSESSSYGPLNLAGTNVGNQDASEVRPMYDGGSSVTTSTTPTTTVTLTRTDVSTQTTRTSRRNQVVVTSCGFLRTRTATTAQTRTESFKTLTTTYNQNTLTSTRTVVVTNGVVTGDNTTSSSVNAVPSSPAAPAPVVSDSTDTGYVNGATTTGACVVSLASPGTSFTTPVVTPADVELSRIPSSLSVTGPTVGATTSNTVTSGGSSDTLSDVAQYYYITDLRTPTLGNCASLDANGNATDVCLNNVPVGSRDLNNGQHLTTFSIGLGVSGTLTYDKDYLTQTSGDYVNLKNGSKTWPATTTTIDGASGDARNIDDLWHSAVNGRGQYYSALSATALADAISGVVSSIKELTGSGAAASFDTLALVSGDTNRIYQAGYTTSIWVGDVKAYAVNGDTGAIADTPLWSAQNRLANTTWSTRTIYYRQAPGSSVLRAFNATNLTADGYGGNFSNLCSKTLVASQCAGLSTGTPNNLALANNSTNLVNYLRGDPSYETSNTTSPLYRSRTTSEGRKLLGDIISGAPVYVGKPPFSYTDAGYSSYASSKATRRPVIYAAANDGMLHAFDAATGNELWAYVPTAVMPKLYKLANNSYKDNHEYFVDGEPVIGDIHVGGTWKTILVGGLGGGGRAYYALDVTDPAAPQTLWEFTDPNLGLAYGNPVITKRADGTWIVAFASGYNNTSGDGKGHLYVLNANTGAKLLDIATTAGSPSSPSGLTKINSWVDKATNNTTTRFYGGDLLGKLWRFDIDNLVAPNQAAHLMAELQTSSGLPQPVTVRPEPVLISGTFPAVAVATGRFLGGSDITDTSQQSVYLLKDSLTATGLGVVRNNTSVVKHTLTVNGTNATTSTEVIDWDTQSGWWFDLPQSGERVITNLGLQENTLTVASAIPRSDACSAGGSSWVYDINIVSGLPNASIIGQLFDADSLIVGLTSTTGVANFQYFKLSDGSIRRRDGAPPLPPGSADPRRSSWRELVD